MKSIEMKEDRKRCLPIIHFIFAPLLCTALQRILEAIEFLMIRRSMEVSLQWLRCAFTSPIFTRYGCFSELHFKLQKVLGNLLVYGRS